jgi:hypothetical protein
VSLYAADDNPFEDPVRAPIANARVGLLKLRQRLREAIESVDFALSDLTEADAEMRDSIAERGTLQ